MDFQVKYKYKLINFLNRGKFIKQTINNNQSIIKWVIKTCEYSNTLFNCHEMFKILFQWWVCSDI